MGDVVVAGTVVVPRGATGIAAEDAPIGSTRLRVRFAPSGARAAVAIAVPVAVISVSPADPAIQPQVYPSPLTSSGGSSPAVDKPRWDGGVPQVGAEVTALRGLSVGGAVVVRRGSHGTVLREAGDGRLVVGFTPNGGGRLRGRVTVRVGPDDIKVADAPSVPAMLPTPVPPPVTEPQIERLPAAAPVAQFGVGTPVEAVLPVKIGGTEVVPARTRGVVSAAASGGRWRVRFAPNGVGAITVEVPSASITRRDAVVNEEPIRKAPTPLRHKAALGVGSRVIARRLIDGTVPLGTQGVVSMAAGPDGLISVKFNGFGEHRVVPGDVAHVSGPFGR